MVSWTGIADSLVVGSFNAIVILGRVFDDARAGQLAALRVEVARGVMSALTAARTSQQSHEPSPPAGPDLLIALSANGASGLVSGAGMRLPDAWWPFSGAKVYARHRRHLTY
jgi:hypothetical protein